MNDSVPVEKWGAQVFYRAQTCCTIVAWLMQALLLELWLYEGTQYRPCLLGVDAPYPLVYCSRLGPRTLDSGLCGINSLHIFTKYTVLRCEYRPGLFTASGHLQQWSLAASTGGEWSPWRGACSGYLWSFWQSLSLFTVSQLLICLDVWNIIIYLDLWYT